MNYRDSHWLIEEARKAAEKSYSPYSNFKVGSSVITKSGNIYLGTNLENASYGLTCCAEVAAIMAANQAGELGNIVAIAITGAPKDQPNYDIPTVPCGRCRQIIMEAAQQGGADIKVVCGSLTGEAIMETTISQLLPDSFSPESLG